MANFFRKQFEEISKIEKNAKKAKIVNQCKCTHNGSDGGHTLKFVENQGKVSAYECENCHAIISTKVPKPEEVREAAKTLITALEYFKMLSMRDSDNVSAKEKEDRELVAKFMVFLISFAKDGYERVLNKNRQKRDGRRRNTRRSTTTFLG